MKSKAVSRVGARRRSRAAPGFAAAAAGVALLLVFGQVVQDAVAQGEARREATARHTDALRQCHALRGAHLRADCLARLGANPLAETSAAERAAVTALYCAVVTGSSRSYSFLTTA